ASAASCAAWIAASRARSHSDAAQRRPWTQSAPPQRRTIAAINPASTSTLFPPRRSCSGDYGAVRRFAQEKMPAPRRSGERVEIIEQGGDPAVIELIHDRRGAPGGGGEIERADALLHPGDICRRHRQLGDAEAQEQRRVARIASHLAAQANRLARAQRRLHGELDEPQRSEE